MSLLYESGRPFIKTKSERRFPYILPVLPRTSSATSGFFFWGIMLLPVQKASGSSINPNSLVDHIMSSSLILEKCIIIIDEAARNSITKSLSDTASRLLLVTLSKPSCLATYPLSIGNVVPASAPEPSGMTSVLL